MLKFGEKDAGRVRIRFLKKNYLIVITPNIPMSKISLFYTAARPWDRRKNTTIDITYLEKKMGKIIFKQHLEKSFWHSYSGSSVAAKRVYELEPNH